MLKFLVQIAELNETIGDLKNSVRERDVEFGNVQRDNERLASELKKQQRCNRNLKRRRIKIKLNENKNSTT